MRRIWRCKTNVVISKNKIIIQLIIKAKINIIIHSISQFADTTKIHMCDAYIFIFYFQTNYNFYYKFI